MKSTLQGTRKVNYPRHSSLAQGGVARLRAAEREARANTELFESFLIRSKETAQSGLEKPDATIISHATVPDRPSFPNRWLLFGVALVGSIALSGATVGFAEGLEED